MLHASTPSPRRALGSIINLTPGRSGSKQTPGSKKTTTPAERATAGKRTPGSKTTAFGKTGVLQSVRGVAPAEATVFGSSGVLERERGDTPEEHKHEGRAAAERRAEVDTFLEAHADARLLGLRVLCVPTGHEVPLDIRALRAHWGGKKYRSAAKRAQRLQGEKAVSEEVRVEKPKPARAQPQPPAQETQAGEPWGVADVRKIREVQAARDAEEEARREGMLRHLSTAFAAALSKPAKPKHALQVEVRAGLPPAEPPAEPPAGEAQHFEFVRLKLRGAEVPDCAEPEAEPLDAPAAAPVADPSDPSDSTELAAEPVSTAAEPAEATPPAETAEPTTEAPVSPTELDEPTETNEPTEAFELAEVLEPAESFEPAEPAPPAEPSGEPTPRDGATVTAVTAGACPLPAPAAGRASACDTFRLDLAGSFGVCKCGAPKAAHTDSAPLAVSEAAPQERGEAPADGLTEQRVREMKVVELRAKLHERGLSMQARRQPLPSLPSPPREPKAARTSDQTRNARRRVSRRRWRRG